MHVYIHLWYLPLAIKEQSNLFPLSPLKLEGEKAKKHK